MGVVTPPTTTTTTTTTSKLPIHELTAFIPLRGLNQDGGHLDLHLRSNTSMVSGLLDGL